MRGSDGRHDHIEVEDGSDAVRFLTAAHDRCWLAGLGWCVISRCGSLLERSIIDRVVGQAEQIVIEAPPIVDPPLAQDATSRRPQVCAGARLDTKSACPSLTGSELQAKAALRAAEDQRLGDEAKRVREAYLDGEAKKIMGHRPGMTLAEARGAIEKRINGVLLADFILPWDDLESMATVGDVLDHPDAFIGQTLADPIDGDERGKAKVMLGRDGLPIIHSFARGGAVFKLRYDAHAVRTRIGQASGDAKVNALARLLRAADVDALEKDKLIREVKKATGVGIRVIKAMIDELEAEQREDDIGNELNGKQVIVVRDGDIHDEWRATERALLGNPKCQIFHRSGFLVEPIWRQEKTVDGHDEQIMAFVPYSVLRLSDVVAHHAVVYMKFNAAQNRMVAIDPPERVIATLLTRQDWMFPTAVGIINTPTMRADGSLVTEEGYDLATKLWYKPATDIKLPPIKERPTREDALAALSTLEELVTEFPFNNKVSKSVAIAGMMTPVLRGAFRIAPMFLIVAPDPGSGKTYLVILCGVIATGRVPIPMATIDNNEEMEKRLSVAAIEASPILFLNNLSFNLDSAMLSQMVSEGTIKPRILGKSEMPPCDCTGMTVFATGNNIRLVGDLVRRAATVRINVKKEDPTDRKFEQDPVKMVLADRGKYLAAIFTIARAYMAEGRVPEGATPLAGFEQWCRMVRYPLMWLGLVDPTASMKDARDRDPQREALRAQIDCLIKHAGVEQNFTAAQLCQKALELSDFNRGYRYQDLFDVLSKDGRQVSAKSVGNMLMSALDKVSGGYHIALVSASSKSANVYKITTKFEEEKAGGELGWRAGKGCGRSRRGGGGRSDVRGGV